MDASVDSPGRDRRRAPRISLRLAALVEDDTAIGRGWLRNVSEGGASFVLDADDGRLAVGSRVRLMFTNGAHEVARTGLIPRIERVPWGDGHAFAYAFAFDVPLEGLDVSISSF